jgi:hypothetical protein
MIANTKYGVGFLCGDRWQLCAKEMLKHQILQKPKYSI